MKVTRTGVLYADGSLLIMMPRDKTEEIEEALDLIEGSNRGERDKTKFAKLVDVDLDASDVTERL